MSDLKILAEAVEGWGNCTKAWLDTSEDDAAAVVGHIDEDGNTYPVAVIDCEQYYAGHDSLKLAKFYAAANPTVVLRLLNEGDSIRQQLASRDAEIADLKVVIDHNLATYHQAAKLLLAERDQLREQVKMLREPAKMLCSQMRGTQAEADFAFPMFLLEEALATTEPTP